MRNTLPYGFSVPLQVPLATPTLLSKAKLKYISFCFQVLRNSPSLPFRGNSFVRVSFTTRLSKVMRIFCFISSLTARPQLRKGNGGVLHRLLRILLVTTRFSLRQWKVLRGGPNHFFLYSHFFQGF